MKLHQKRISRWIPAVLLLVSTSAIHAQDDIGAAVDMTGMGILAMEESVMQAARETVKKPPRTRPSKVTQSSTAGFTFTPSAARRRANLAQFVARTRAKNPQAGANLQKLISSQDVIAATNRELIKLGLRPNNAADAYAAWWLGAWLASRGRLDNPTRSQIAAVRTQATQALLRVPAMKSAGDATKQQFSEAHLLQAALIGGMLSQAKDNPAQLKIIATNVRQGARASGLDLDAMELTNSGFQPRN